MIFFNGKKSTKKEVLNKLDDPSVKVTNLKIELSSDKVKEAPSYEGFDIDQQSISAFAKKKDEANASILALTFKNSSKINNNSLVLLFLRKEELTNEELKACKVLGINLE